MSIQQYEKQQTRTIPLNYGKVLYVPLPEHLVGFRFYQPDMSSSHPAVNLKLSENEQAEAIEEFGELIEETLFYSEEGTLPEEWSVYSCKVARQLDPFANSAIIREGVTASANDEDIVADPQELPPPEPCRNCPVYKKREAYCWLKINRLKAQQAPAFDAAYWDSQYSVPVN